MRMLFPTVRIVLAAAAALFAAGCAAVVPPQRAAMQFATVSQGDTTIKLAYRERGQGAPVLLIHGFGANAYTWRHLEPVLAQNRRVIVIDLKGFGQSDKPIDERYSVLDQAALVERFIEQKQLTNLTVIGHSLGGGVALMMALNEVPKRHKRIARIALLDTVAYEQNIPLAFSILRMPVIGPMSTFLVPKELQARTALRIAFRDDSKFDRNDVAEYAGPLHERGSQHALIFSARQIIPENIGELSARYPTIRIPAMILWCSHDKVIRPNIGWRLHQALPRSTFRVLHDCGHIPQEEDPQETARILTDFIAR